jgi:hypothetical protein
LGLCKVKVDYRGSRAVPGRRIEGEGEVLAGASGFPSSLDAKQKKTSRKGFLKLLDIQREIPSRSPSLSLVG